MLSETVGHGYDAEVGHLLYAELVPGSANKGAVDYRALLAGQPQPVTGPGYQLFRIGDAVNSRNIHAAIFDALRLCATA